MLIFDKFFSPKKPAHSGFSLIELLLVIVIVGILAAVAVPSLIKAKRSAETSAVIGNLRTFNTHQTTYMAVNGRYARIVELNSFMGNSLGTTSGRSIYQGEYRYRNYPSTNPTDAYLKTQYGILATRIENGYFALYITMEENGLITIYES